MECNSTAPPISPASLYVEQLASRLSAAPLLFSASVSSTYSFRSDPSPRRLSTKLKPRRCCFSPALLLFFGAAALLTSVLDITTHGAVSYGCRPFRFRASHQRGHVPSLFLLLRVALKSSLPVLVFSAAPSVFPSIFPPAPCNFFPPRRSFSYRRWHSSQRRPRNCKYMALSLLILLFPRFASHLPASRCVEQLLSQLPQLLTGVHSFTITPQHHSAADYSLLFRAVAQLGDTGVEPLISIAAPKPLFPALLLQSAASFASTSSAAASVSSMSLFKGDK